MEQLSIALVCLFCLFFVLAPIIGAFITQRRCLTPNVTDPGPKDLIRARRKLSTVTACSTVSGPGSGGVHPSSERGHHEQGEGGRDVEPDATQCSTEECPICIGPLVPEPALVDGRSISRALDELTLVASERTRAGPRHIGCSPDRNYYYRGYRGWLPFRRPRRPRRQCHSQRPVDEENNAAAGDLADDVLTLNSCGHAFHSRCLASWFLMERFDCPLCRSVYYHRKTLPSRATVSVTFPPVAFRG